MKVNPNVMGGVRCPSNFFVGFSGNRLSRKKPPNSCMFRK